MGAAKGGKSLKAAAKTVAKAAQSTGPMKISIPSGMASAGPPLGPMLGQVSKSFKYL